MRISLPVCPARKTSSEVATVNWVRHETDFPLPEILAYDSTRDIPLGFEWILMRFLPGKSLELMWSNMSLSVKSNLVRKFAKFQASLWRNQLRGIGNIYLATDSEAPGLNKTECPNDAGPKIGQIVSQPFFSGSRARRDVNRGPFISSRDWIGARLALAREDCEELLFKYSIGRNVFVKGAVRYRKAKSDIRNAEEVQQLLNAMEALAPRLFPETAQISEPTVVFHNDLHAENILVDDDGNLTGVLDWECVSALPLWKACYFPSFLHGFPRDSKPDINDYDDGNPQPDTAYFEHLEEFEKTTLRKVFMEEMGVLEPEWVTHFNANHLRRDFDVALEFIHDEMARSDIRTWITAVTDNHPSPISLRETLGC